MQIFEVAFKNWFVISTLEWQMMQLQKESDTFIAIISDIFPDLRYFMEETTGFQKSIHGYNEWMEGDEELNSELHRTSFKYQCCSD